MKIEELNLKPQLVEAIKDLGFTEFTNIQENVYLDITGKRYIRTF